MYATIGLDWIRSEVGGRRSEVRSQRVESVGHLKEKGVVAGVYERRGEDDHG